MITLDEAIEEIHKQFEVAVQKIQKDGKKIVNISGLERASLEDLERVDKILKQVVPNYIKRWNDRIFTLSSVGRAAAC